MWKDNVFIALGSNMEDSVQTFNRAILEISKIADEITKSAIYITKPYGFTEQNDFHNAVIRIKTTQEPLELLQSLQHIEHKLGKKVIRENGPRLIDLDLIFYDQQVLNDNSLELPHPRAHERDFVLIPMADIDPKFSHPVKRQSVSELISQLEHSYFTGVKIEWQA
jgi:2-amino-4-hydroxy-6-hydroxymethyldihydropteridine diphosphokinase